MNSQINRRQILSGEMALWRSCNSRLDGLKQALKVVVQASTLQVHCPSHGNERRLYLARFCCRHQIIMTDSL